MLKVGENVVLSLTLTDLLLAEDSSFIQFVIKDANGEIILQSQQGVTVKGEWTLL